MNTPLPPHPEPLWQETIPGGGHWSGVLRRGQVLRLIDVQGSANVAALLYHAAEKLERYNMADTLKAQHTAHLTAGHVLYSDMGRVLCSIVEDSCGWHDPLCGVADAASATQKYGASSYQTDRNARVRNGRDSLLIELGKWGLGRRDLLPNVNFFSKVVADEAGELAFDTAHRTPGAAVDLRFEMDVLLALATAPHPLDPRPVYAPGEVTLIAWHGAPVAADDRCRNACAENQRGFYRTEIFQR